MLQKRSDLQPFLDRLTKRSRLTEAEQQAILGLPTRTSQVHANRDFVRLDERVEDASIVVEGVIGSFGQTKEGARQITALHIAGDAPDLHSVVLPKARAALQALTTATILRVPHAELRSLASKFPAVAAAFWRDSMVDASILGQWVVNVGRRDAKTRMAHLLLELARRYGARPADGEVSFSLPLTQTHLADATGLTAVHVNRTLRALRDEGLVVVSNRTARILDWKGLAELGEFDPDYLQDNISPEDRLRIPETA